MLNPVSILTQFEQIAAIIHHPLVVAPDTSVMAAILQMNAIGTVDSSSVAPSQLAESPIQARSSCIAIVADGQLLGILTKRDALRLIAEQRDLDNLAIRAVMTSNLVTLRASALTDLAVAADLFQQHQIHHLPIVDDRNCLVGILTHESLQDLLAAALAAKVLQLEAEKVLLLRNLKGETIGVLGTYQDITDRQHKHDSVIRQQTERESVLREMTQRIRRSLELPTIFETAVQEIRQFMETDRVGIFKFDSDFNFDEGEFVAESVGAEFESILGAKIHDPGFTEKLARYYQKGKISAVEDIHTAGLLDYEVRVLAKFQVRANLVIPLLNGTALWGLLCIHHCAAPRSWQAIEVDLIEHIAEQIGIAIHQATLYEKVQSELGVRWQAETQLRQSNQQLAISNQELARATRLKDEFLANMSHELRTPLNAILGMSEALQDRVFGPINDRQHKSIATISKSGKHLLALINDILDLSKIEANKFNLELTDVPVQDLCQNSLLFIKELALKKQIRLTTQLPDYLKRIGIRVDDRRCRQVLINLLSNAVKFTPAGGSITLDVRVLNGQGETGGRGDLPLAIETADLPPPLRQIAFSIIDTGIGIAPENIDKLFQSFVQIDSSLSRQYAGTGLGLALVKRIVEIHGGTVSVQSQVDRGSCFTISLPFCPSAAIAVPPSLPSLVYPLTTDPDDTPAMIQPKALVLVVEDNAANMETMTGYLESRGYRLIEAENGQMAIDLAQTQHPDIILMDIQMPDMDGFAAIAQIRQIPDCAGMPIIALTALAMPLDRQKCLDAGADRYVTKPVKLSQLVSTIETLLHGD